MEGLQISSFNAVEDFETVAANVREKIDTYFSQLLETIRNRQTSLISELDEILSRYRQGRARQRDKVRELEEIKKYHEDRSSKDQLNEVLNNIKSDLAEALNANTNTISVEFEWDSAYARKASKIGKLIQISKNRSIGKEDTLATKISTSSDVILVDVAYAYDSNPQSPLDSIDSELYSYATPFSQAETPSARSLKLSRSNSKQSVHSSKFHSRQLYFELVKGSPTQKKVETIEIKKETSSDVIMTGTDYSSFIFSRRLYEGLIYRTDVGPIPRDSPREEHMSSEFANTANWRRAIEGCYWCGKATRSNQYTYVCDKKCYSLLHEWCRRKLCEFCGDSLCMLPGCEQVAVESANCCSDNHLWKLETRFKTIYNSTNEMTRVPHWYNKLDAVSCSSHCSSPVSKTQLKRSINSESSLTNTQIRHKKVCKFPVSQSVSDTSSLSHETSAARESLIPKREEDRFGLPPPYNPDFKQTNFTESVQYK